LPAGAVKLRPAKPWLRRVVRGASGEPTIAAVVDAATFKETAVAGPPAHMLASDRTFHWS
jgi:hypothetical protein